jgi:hypothetical protein
VRQQAGGVKSATGLLPCSQNGPEHSKEGLAFTEATGHNLSEPGPLASALIRRRVSFRTPPAKADHFCAIDKTHRDATKWDVNEEADTVRFITAELNIRLHRNPLLIGLYGTTAACCILANPHSCSGFCRGRW